MKSSVVWKRWVKDTRTLQRRCARDGYRMLVSVKLEPARRRKSAAKPNEVKRGKTLGEQYPCAECGEAYCDCEGRFQP